MTDGVIHEMSQMLGELLAGQRALDAKIDSKIDALDERIIGNHADAGKQWDRIDSELRTIKHDQRGLEQRSISQSEAIRRIGATVRPLPEKIDAIDHRVAAVEIVNVRVDKLDERLGSIERLAYKLAGVAAAVAAAVTIFVPLVVHYGGEFVRWATGRH
jgi:hypothetical protein